MASYAVRVHHNATDDNASETIEYDISDNEYTEGEIRLRLLEVQSMNLANLTASAERIAKALEALAQYGAGF